MHITVVIPAYNESERIGAVLKGIPASLAGHEVSVLVVDDGSQDTTASAVRKLNLSRVRVVRHSANLGKGAAAKTGCDAAYSAGADLIVLMDADGQHRPEDLGLLLAPLLESDEVDLVLGVRRFSGQMPFMMRLGNRLLNFMARSLFHIDVQDTQSGYRAFRGSAYPKIRWAASQYAMETEMLILSAIHGIGMAEVAIDTIYLDGYKGTTALDGLRVAQTFIKWKLPWYRDYRSLESSSL